MIETERLILRQWRPEDKEPFYKMSSSPKVMEYFPSTLSREESDAFVDKMHEIIEQNGWGMFAVEEKTSAQFMGVLGLAVPPYKTHFSPFTEIGWRLSDRFWGQGYATEGGKAALDYGFSTLKLDEIVAFTSKHNKPSMAVMERLGMTRDLDGDFDHPNVPSGHPLCLHMLYRIQNQKSAKG